MKITRVQLRKVIREACGLGSPEENENELPLPLPPLPPAASPEQAPLPLPPIVQSPAPAMVAMPGVPVPEDYNKVRDFLEITPGMNDLTIDSVKQSAGTGCERSTAQGIIDHLKDELHGMG